MLNLGGCIQLQRQGFELRSANYPRDISAISNTWKTFFNGRPGISGTFERPMMLWTSLVTHRR